MGPRKQHAACWAAGHDVVRGQSQPHGHRHKHKQVSNRHHTRASRGNLTGKLKHAAKQACRRKSAAIRAILMEAAGVQRWLRVGSSQALRRMLGCTHNAGIRRALGMLRLHQAGRLSITNNSASHGLTKHTAHPPSGHLQQGDSGHQHQAEATAVATTAAGSAAAAAGSTGLLQAPASTAAASGRGLTPMTADVRGPIAESANTPVATTISPAATGLPVCSAAMPRLRKRHKWVQEGQTAAPGSQAATSNAAQPDADQGAAHIEQPQQQLAAPPLSPFKAQQLGPSDAALIHSRQPSALMAALQGGPHLQAVKRLRKHPPSGDTLLAETRRGHSTQPLHMRDLQKLLQSDGWLNDEVVNFYMQLLQKRNDQQCLAQAAHTDLKPLQVYIFNSFFWTQLTLPVGRAAGALHTGQHVASPIPGRVHRHRGNDRWVRKQAVQLHNTTTSTVSGGYPCQYANVQRWTRPKKTHTQDCILWRDLILVPINITQSHWCLAAIWPHRQLIQLYDSLACCHTRARHMMHTLARWYCNDLIDKAEYAPSTPRAPVDTAACTHQQTSRLPIHSGQCQQHMPHQGRPLGDGAGAVCKQHRQPFTWRTHALPQQKQASRLEGVLQEGVPLGLQQGCDKAKPIGLKQHLHGTHATEAATSSGVLQPSMFRCEVVPSLPGQMDGSACGVFMCAFAELLARGVQPPFEFTQSDMEKSRKGIAAELLAGSCFVP